MKVNCFFVSIWEYFSSWLWSLSFSSQERLREETRKAQIKFYRCPGENSVLQFFGILSVTSTGTYLLKSYVYGCCCFDLIWVEWGGGGVGSSVA